MKPWKKRYNNIFQKTLRRYLAAFPYAVNKEVTEKLEKVFISDFIGLAGIASETNPLP